MDQLKKIESKQDFLTALTHKSDNYCNPTNTYFVMADGGVIRFDVATEEKQTILDCIDFELSYKGASLDHDYHNLADPQWVPRFLLINWENQDLTCDHSNQKIESVY